MKRRELLNGREEEMMYILWDVGEPSTSVDMLDRLLDDGWNRSTVFNTIQSLIDKHFLKVTGVEKSNTQYARQFEPAITREEYAAKLLIEKGIDCEKLGNIAVAMIGS
ncbi:MAG: BlaI/MecI/CopY family transcriptional regulator, partial [Lachnospiraceae bacterium]|nr:BlaI/MecI/CopY family transcriptional regulator [Lachnospiraceae bacterium]